MIRRLAAFLLVVAAAFSAGCASHHVARPVPDNPLLAVDESSWDPEINRWEKHFLGRMEKFRAENAQLEAGRRHVVFAGDSITEGFPLGDYLGDLPVLNRGIGADGIASFPDRIRPRGLENRLATSVFDCNPAIVFILMGINDMPHDGVPMEYWEQHYEGIVDAIQKGSPGTAIIIQTLLPTGEKYANNAKVNPRVLDFNGRLRGIAKRKGVEVLDLYSLYVDGNGLLQGDVTGDGLHLAKPAYERWAKAARPFAEKALRE